MSVLPADNEIIRVLAAAEAEIERSEKHRNDLMDSIVELRTEIVALRRELAETRDKALEEAASIEVPFPRTLGPAMLDSPFQAVERYRALIRTLKALDHSNGR